MSDSDPDRDQFPLVDWKWTGNDPRPDHIFDLDLGAVVDRETGTKRYDRDRRFKHPHERRSAAGLREQGVVLRPRYMEGRGRGDAIRGERTHPETGRLNPGSEVMEMKHPEARTQESIMRQFEYAARQTMAYIRTHGHR